MTLLSTLWHLIPYDLNRKSTRLREHCVKPAYHAAAMFISHHRINNKRIAFADTQDYQPNAAAEPELSSIENTVQPADLN